MNKLSSSMWSSPAWYARRMSGLSANRSSTVQSAHDSGKSMSGNSSVNMRPQWMKERTTPSRGISLMASLIHELVLQTIEQRELIEVNEVRRPLPLNKHVLHLVGEVTQSARSARLFVLIKGVRLMLALYIESVR